MQHKHQLPTLEELKKNRRPIRHSHKIVRENFSLLESFALSITRSVGTVGFFFLLAAWTIGWLIWNLYGPSSMRFDPAPAFVIWIFVSNVIQLVLLPLIMVGQNLESKFAEQRAQADFDINQKSEYEIEVVVGHLENQNQILEDILKKLEK